MKYIISSIIFLLLISSGVLGYGYYRQYLQLESKNIQISEFEARIRDLNSNIQELEQKNKALQQDNRQLSDTVAVQKKNIEHLEKFIADKKLNIPSPPSVESSNSKDTPVGTESNVTIGDNTPVDDSDAESSSLWYWIVFAVIIVTIAIIIVICKIRKRNASEFHKSKKFICPSCGWEYRTPVAECENCKTIF